MKDEVLTTSRPMTVEEYIEFEERSEIRHEFINGNLIPMPGTTVDHNDICFNLKAALKQILKNLRVQTENVKAQFGAENDYTYPDVIVTSDPRDADNQYIIQHPSVIFEVMSKSSRIYDSTDKFILYKNIASLQNYILVDSEKIFVEVRVKLENGDWEASTYLQSDERFPIPALGVTLELSDVYEGVSFMVDKG
ncbi:MAG: Uma2 family endonuclease [Saprospiraceae bacterium]|nr:Uma2 family endonuclease [Saprospiraceae bacterium]